jgi:hypothetical protein
VISRPPSRSTSLEKGPAGARQVFRAFYVYDLPLLQNSKSRLAKIAGNWQIAGSVWARSPVARTCAQRKRITDVSAPYFSSGTPGCFLFSRQTERAAPAEFAAPRDAALVPWL